MTDVPDSRPIPSFPCPKCGKPSMWNDNPSRPFCSERCKLVDLGAWANEDYRVADQGPAKTAAQQDYDIEDDAL